MVTETAEAAFLRRRVILHDSLAFLSIAVVTLVLFGITLLLFRSFSAHQDALARRWSKRGVDAMQAHRAGEAVVALRTALSYAPDTRAYQLLLAQALGEAGRVDESYNYFEELWQTQPGDGFINLELARLAARRGDTNAAIQFYRASIYGTWEGDGVARRAQVRLELGKYLIAHRQYAQARMELQITGGNSPETRELDETIAELLEQAQDPADAWNFYGKAIALQPHDPELLERAGRLAYGLARYDTAHKLLTRAEAARADAKLPPDPALGAQAAQAARLLDLDAPASLPNAERVRRIVADREIAKSRLDACIAAAVPPNAGEHPTGGATANGQAAMAQSSTVPASLAAIASRWSSPEATANAAGLRRDPALQDAALVLVDETELTAAKTCAPATGDDALLVQLAQHSAGANGNADGAERAPQSAAQQQGAR